MDVGLLKEVLVCMGFLGEGVVIYFMFCVLVQGVGDSLLLDLSMVSVLGGADLGLIGEIISGDAGVKYDGSCGFEVMGV